MDEADARLNGIMSVDVHAHPPAAGGLRTTSELHRRFTLSVPPDDFGDLVPTTISYRWAIRTLAAELGCAPSEGGLLEASADPSYAIRLLKASRTASVIMDFGYGGESPVETVSLLANCGIAMHRVSRLETIFGDLVGGLETLDEIETELLRRLDAELEAGSIGLKSIVAYRTGLALELHSRGQVTTALAAARSQLGAAVGPTRLLHKPLVDHLLWTSLEWASGARLPVQFHCGFGDREIDLSKSNPLGLRPVLESRQLRGAPIVLLHCAYPFSREAGFLAGVYPHLYLDLSLANLHAGLVYQPVLLELLAMAPVSHVLYGSDSGASPEHFFLASVVTRRVLAAVLAEMTSAGWIEGSEVDAIASAILRDNAHALYPATAEAD